MTLTIIFSLLLSWMNPVPQTALATRAVDVKASTLTWTGYKVTGQHTGNVKIKSGDLIFSGDVVTGGSFVIDVTSITCTDLDAEYGGKLVGHLKSDDFFGADKYPTASLKITRAIPQGDGSYKILADLTIKGKTNPTKFVAKVAKEGNKQVATAEIKVDRSEYDIRYGSGSFFDNLGDKTIYDEFDLNVRLVLN